MWDRIKNWDWETILGLGWIPLLIVLGVISWIISSVGESKSTSSDSHSGAYYRNCDAARSAGVAPLYVGEPGYRDALDRDGDGVACEPYKGR